MNRILQRVGHGVHIDRSVLDALLHEKPAPEALVSLLASADPATVRAAVLYLGMYGTMRQCAVLALCLHHDDEGVARLAEHCLWSIWMQGGTDDGNRRLADAVARMNAGEHAQALEILDGLVADEPEFAEAHFQRGLALDCLERPEVADHAYQRTLRLNPYHFGAAAALGHTCVERGNLRGALHFYRQALRIHPHLEDVPAAIQELEVLMRSSRGQHA